MLVLRRQSLSLQRLILFSFYCKFTQHDLGAKWPISSKQLTVISFPFPLCCILKPPNPHKVVTRASFLLCGCRHCTKPDMWAEVLMQWCSKWWVISLRDSVTIKEKGSFSYEIITFPRILHLENYLDDLIVLLPDTWVIESDLHYAL